VHFEVSDELVLTVSIVDARFTTYYYRLLTYDIGCLTVSQGGSRGYVTFGRRAFR